MRQIGWMLVATSMLGACTVAPTAMRLPVSAPVAAQAKATIPAQAKQFVRLDRNKDGVLTQAESGFGSSEFYNADQDGNKKLSLKEYFRVHPPLANFQTRLAKAADKAMAAADSSRDGLVTLTEYKKTLTKRDKATQAALTKAYALSDIDPADKYLNYVEMMNQMAWEFALSTAILMPVEPTTSSGGGFFEEPNSGYTPSNGGFFEEPTGGGGSGFYDDPTGGNGGGGGFYDDPTNGGPNEPFLG